MEYLLFYTCIQIELQFFIKNNYSTDKVIPKIIFQSYFRYFLINYLEIKVKNLRFPFCNKKYESFKLKWNIYPFKFFFSNPCAVFSFSKLISFQGYLTKTKKKITYLFD